MNIFEINDLSDIQEFEIDGSKVYVKDNFYKNPDLVLEYIESHKPEIWKSHETPSFNMIHFEELRHHIETEDITEISIELGKIISQISTAPNTIVTNYIKFIDKNFNNYVENYWWPHVDIGYNAIIYFDNFDTEIPGTNLYQKVKDIEYNQHEYPEHFRPWIPKKDFDLVHTFSSKFNRLVLFDGKKFFHGMSINDDRFFCDIFRKNQVMFFTDTLEFNTEFNHVV
jgi:hypothetical protein